ncbi:MAG: SMC family ATPase, partial [Bacteroidota bacterium]
MILKHLHLEYFKQYGQLDVSFREGLVGIVGRNGAGKSSLFEAVLLCLFGRTTSDKEFYKTSWAPAKSPTILELTFELGLTSYRVRREFRGKAMQHHAFLYNARDELQASGATPVGEAIAQLVGLDKDAFTRSVFSGQKELGILSNTKGEERKRMVRRMVGLDKLDKIQQLLREDRNSKKREIQGQQALLWSKEEQKALKDQIKEQKGSIQKSQQNTDRLQKDYQAKNAEYLDWKKSFDLLNQRYKQFNELQKELVKWEKALESLQNRQKELTKELAQLQE